MVKTIHVEGYDAVKKAIKENSSIQDLFVLFSGSKDANGVSWCPDCVAGLYYLITWQCFIRKLKFNHSLFMYVFLINPIILSNGF